jgi:hypothetical protein
MDSSLLDFRTFVLYNDHEIMEIRNYETYAFPSCLRPTANCPPKAFEPDSNCSRTLVNRVLFRNQPLPPSAPPPNPDQYIPSQLRIPINPVITRNQFFKYGFGGGWEGVRSCPPPKSIRTSENRNTLRVLRFGDAERSSLGTVELLAHCRKSVLF